MVITTLSASPHVRHNDNNNKNNSKSVITAHSLENALRKHTITPPSSDRQERTSFASFKEDRTAIAQSFIDSKVSSYARNSEEAVDDSDRSFVTPPNGINVPSSHDNYPTSGVTVSLTNPQSALHGFVCPCDGFRGWKSISVRGMIASKSFGDLRMVSQGFAWEAAPLTAKPRLLKRPSMLNPGEAPIEKLPTELLGNIIDHLVTDIPPNGFQPRNIDLMSLLLTSRAMHSATLATLYNQVTIPHSDVFRKFLAHVTEHPSLGTIVRRLDFSHFNPVRAGLTARERAENQNLTPKTLLQCLDLLPNLREFLAQEHIDEDISADVVKKLLNMPRLHALDLCASSSASFRDAMMTVMRSSGSLDLPQVLPITRLSLHECTILPSVIFESLLPRLPRLTHLDVTHTRITDRALASIPETARLTHLNISKCSTLSGDEVVKFISTHPAVKDTLIYLNLLMDAKSAEMLSAVDITALLPKLPSTLRSLNLKGSSMTSNHIPLLLPLTKHLEELGVGRNIPYEDISSLIRLPPNSSEEERAAWTPHTLRYLDISDLEPSQIDLGLLFGQSQSILKDTSMPLEVIEVCQKMYDKLHDREHICRQFGWVVKEAGRRGWVVRDLSKMGQDKDDGARTWKMGATYWGMRKVPVARAEVGGMYGLYMFKR